MTRREDRLNPVNSLGMTTGVPETMNSFPEDGDDRMPEEIRLRFHELSMHQIELEVQNEELRRLQGELHDARERYFDLYDRAPVGYCTLSERGLILEANLTAATLLGATREALIRQPLTRFIHRDDQDIYYLYCKRNLPTCGPEVCELRMVKEDGTDFWAQLATSTAQVARGVSECRLIITDISRRKHHEEALRQSEQKAVEAKNLLKLVLDTIPIRLFWKDLSSAYLGCNQLFAQDAGFEIPEELIGLDDASMAWGEQADSYRRNDIEVINSGKAKLHSEEVQTTPDGRQMWVSASKVPLRDAAGQIIGVLGAYQDITQQKQDEEDRLKAWSLEPLGALASDIAHKFNNILMVVLGHVSFAKMLLDPTGKAYERLTLAESAAMQAKELTRQFHTLSREGAPALTSIPTAYLITNNAHLALRDARSNCICNLPGDLWNIEADEEQIGQALTNILINADQSMPEGGTIRIACENAVFGDDPGQPLKKGEYVKITITNQGSGMPEEDLCGTLDPSCPTREKGRGLRLAAASSILNRHDGYLAVESIPGVGATFTLFIPASPVRTTTEGPLPQGQVAPGAKSTGGKHELSTTGHSFDQEIYLP